MTKSAALDYAPYGITVNAICPGYTRTSIFGDAPEQALAMLAGYPLLAVRLSDTSNMKNEK